MSQSIADQLKSIKKRSEQTKNDLLLAQRRMAEQQEAKVKCAELKRALLNKRMQQLAEENLLDFSSIIPDQYESIGRMCYKAMTRLSNFNLGITADDLKHDVIVLLLTQEHKPAKSIGSLLYRLINKSLEQYIAKHVIISHVWAQGKRERLYTSVYNNIEQVGAIPSGHSRFNAIVRSNEQRATTPSNMD